MPRARYTIMREFLGARGSLALEMMHATGSVQVSLDFCSEADAARKLRVALALSPVVAALYANSSISRGVPNGFLSRRAWIWHHTDPARCGLLPFVFGPDWGEGCAYERYVEWALDVPMIFVLRGGVHHPMNGRTFRDFLAHGAGDLRPLLADWNLHLTTLFPEVRLKRVIELRSADAVPPGLVCALPALWKGLLYDDATLREAEAWVRPWSFEQVDALHAEVARRALEARTPHGPLLPLAGRLVDLATAGLRKIGARSPSGEEEAVFLDPLHEILDRGSSPGQVLLERWNRARGQRIEDLVEYAQY